MTRSERARRVREQLQTLAALRAEHTARQLPSTIASSFGRLWPIGIGAESTQRFVETNDSRHRENEQFMTISNLADRIARNNRIAAAIEARFTAIDPKWNDEEPGQGRSIKRVAYSHGQRNGRIHFRLSGSGVTTENRAAFEQAIMDGIAAATQT